MLIRTATFKITKKELRNLLMIRYLKERRNLLISFSVMTVVYFVIWIAYTFSGNSNRFLGILFLFCFIFVLFMVSVFFLIPFTWDFTKVIPKADFMNKYWECDENFIFIHYEDGSLTKFRFEHLLQVAKTKKFYLLCFTTYDRTEQVPIHQAIPIAAFTSKKDIDRFDLLLQGKQIIKLWT